MTNAEEMVIPEVLKLLKQYANMHVDKWINATGDSAKAEAWAILQASHHIEQHYKLKS